MNRALLINYNLLTPGQKYAPLIELIKSSGTYCYLGGSVWAIVTTRTPQETVQAIRRVIDSNDQVIVLDVTNDSWWSAGYSQEVVDWLKNNLAVGARSY